MSQDTIITVQNVSKKFRQYASVADGVKEMLHPLRKKYHQEFWALKDISFEVKKGDSIGIVGRNGSGKSTLMQILCGILQVTSGEVAVHGRVSALLELGAGFHPQFTGRENVYLNGAIMGFSKEEVDQRFQAIADFADIGDFIDQPVRTYSNGMFVRLAFAAAINVSPDILIVDEALAVGDMFFQAQCMQRLQSLMDEGVTVLLVTHDINAVKNLCTKCLYLDQGSMQIFGPSSEVTDSFMRRIEQDMNETPRQIKSLKRILGFGDDKCEIVQGLFKIDKVFMERMESKRHGSGEALITGVELLDMNNNFLEEVDFNQKVVVRIHILFKQQQELTIVYQIRDEKLIPVLESYSLLEDEKLLYGRPGERYVADFMTKLPLTDGNYNIIARLSNPIIPNQRAYFVDAVENAYVFKMNQRLPYKTWARVYIENDFVLRKEG